VDGLNSWAEQTGGKGVSILGTFIDLEEPYLDYNLKTELETAWTNNYVLFINVTSSHSAADLANGKYDSAVNQWATIYKQWVSKGGGRWSMIAPLPEMNGNWTPYGLDPVSFKLFYNKMQDTFSTMGIPSSSVRWVFAPNGFSEIGDPGFEDYYPGGNRVSIVGFSSYNSGYCSTQWPQWDNAEKLFGSYIQRVRNIATGKPIFIAQTATTSYIQANYSDTAAKNQWLLDSYAYLANQNVQAVLYFNKDKECDWAFYQSSGRKLDGYRQAVAGSSFIQLGPIDLLEKFP
jgi:beta-mannanase